MARAPESILSRCLGTEAYAFAVSVPLTAREFLNDYQASLQGQGGDFAAQAAEGRLIDSAAKEYEIAARWINESCSVASALKIPVVTRATLADVKQLLSERPILIFISHLRLPEITEADCLSPDQIVRVIQNPETPLQHELRKEVKWFFKRPLSALSGELRERIEGILLRAKPLHAGLDHRAYNDLPDEALPQETLAEILNQVHRNAFAAYQSPNEHQAEALQQSNAEQSNEQSSTLRRMHRIAIEDALGPTFRRGKCIEFHDGMHDVESFIQCIPECDPDNIQPEDERVIDMTLCNSVVLTASIENERRHCRLRAGFYPTKPSYAGIYCSTLFRIIAEAQKTKGISYSDASHSTRSNLMIEAKRLSGLEAIKHRILTLFRRKS